MATTIIVNGIPTRIEDYNPYSHTTSNFLMEGGAIKNHERLGLPLDLTNRWIGINAKWTTPFEKYMDKYKQRTPAVTDELMSIIAEAQQFDLDNKFLARIAISPNATVNDLEIFNIREGLRKGRTRTKPQLAITTQVDAQMQPIGGGSIKVKCYASGSRPSIPEPGDSVQYRYITGETAPTSAEDSNLKMNFNTRSSFIISTGDNNVGLRLFIYFRWFNTRHQEIVGPWSKLESTIIL